MIVGHINCEHTNFLKMRLTRDSQPVTVYGNSYITAKLKFRRISFDNALYIDCSAKMFQLNEELFALHSPDTPQNNTVPQKVLARILFATHCIKEPFKISCGILKSQPHGSHKSMFIYPSFRREHINLYVQLTGRLPRGQLDRRQSRTSMFMCLFPSLFGIQSP